MTTPEEQAALDRFLDGFAEAVLIDLADSPDDEVVPIGRFILEAFDAEAKGYDYPPEVREYTATAGELRNRFRRTREQLAAEQ